MHDKDNTQFIRTFTAPGPRNQWFPKALVDPAFYHSLMMISAGNVAGLQGKPAPQSFWYHRGEAIRQINARLTQIELAASDHTIATIAVLSIADVSDDANITRCAPKRLTLFA